MLSLAAGACVRGLAARLVWRATHIPCPSSSSRDGPPSMTERYRRARPNSSRYSDAHRPGIAPVRRDHPADPYLRDADTDGIVCALLMPDGRRRAPFSPASATLTGERARFRSLAPPVEVWVAVMGGVAGSAEAAGSRAVGRPWAWRWAGGKASGYHRQRRVEHAFFRCTSIIGDGLRARSPAGQESEVVLGCEILNRLTALGRPVSYRLGR